MKYIELIFQQGNSLLLMPIFMFPNNHKTLFKSYEINNLNKSKDTRTFD